MHSFVGDSSVLLWMASALVALLGARTFVEYLRRLHHDGPVRLWRELLLGSAALATGLWSAQVIGISAQGLNFEVGYHPLKVFGSLAACFLALTLVLGWVTFRPAWPSQLAAVALATLVATTQQIAVVWSIGAEPDLTWRIEPLVFSMSLLLVGFAAAGRLVVAARRGSTGDRAGRRLLGALVLTACVVAAQELVLIASGLDRQVVSAHARLLPEVIVSLLAGTVVPVGLVLLLVDQRGQQRARASERARRRHRSRASDNESLFSDSAAIGPSDAPKPHQH